MISDNVVRVCNLKKGDFFIHFGLEYQVVYVDEKDILYIVVGGGNKNRFGRNSKQMVEIVKYPYIKKRETEEIL